MLLSKLFRALVGFRLGGLPSVTAARSERFAKPEFHTYLQAAEWVSGDQRGRGIYSLALINPPTAFGEVFMESSIRR